MAFQVLAIEGSKQYYAYLDQCGKGVVSIDVLKVSCVEDSALFDLTLGQIPFNPDGLQVKICHDTFEYNDIHAVELTRASRILRVRTSASAKAKLLCADPNDVKVISDVKFLVKRVEDWYRQYGDRVRIPTEHPAVSAYMKTGLQAPSSDQSTAIEGALSNPFTYIWGAPGTGKTKFVLSRCVLSYLKAGKRILIAAPTNNAVEQTLYGVLDVFEEAGIDYKGKLLRLGMASAAFAGKYPDACEDRVQIKLLASLTSQLQTVSADIPKLEAHLKEIQSYEKLQNTWKSFSNIKPKLLDDIAQLDNLQKQSISTQTQLDLLTGKQTASHIQQSKLKQELAHASAQVKAYADKTEQHAHGWRHALFRKRFEAYQASLTQSLEQAAQLEKQLDQIKALLSDMEQSQKALESELQKISEQQHTVLLHLRANSQLFAPICKPFSAAEIPIHTEEATAIIEDYAEYLEKKIQLSAPPTGASLEDTLAALAEQKKQLSTLQAQKTSLDTALAAKTADCRILAATIDTCIGRLPPNDALSRFSHVFLDEAGYCSLVKAATLTAYHCPLTFLGDHMQLPPVCEMNDQSIAANPAVSVWAQSALFVEDALSGRDIASDYLNHRPASFRQMKKYNLVHTYRFGESLAAVLAKNVYSAQFHGNPESDTEIFCIHASKQCGEKNRTNLGEQIAIQRYLETHANENIGVITPYRNQREILTKTVKKIGLSPETVLTVHGAQGREWDTVLFSVVDTDGKWFTTTLIPKSNGTQIINTAVSRAKKKLILVCDCEYWSRQSNELIGKLLQIARPI